MAFAGETAPPVKHPNLLLNREELNAIKIKIAENDWAMKLFEKVRKMADEGNRLEAALVYAITGENGDRVHRDMVNDARYWGGRARQVDVKASPEELAWGEWGRMAWTYDLAWELLSDQERKEAEDSLRAICRVIIEGDKLWTTTPNLVFGKHHNVGLVGYALGDRELIEWGLNDPGSFGPSKGGFYQVLDSMIKDGHFWAEAPIYALHYDVHGMIALAEAARRYDGTDLYAYVSKKSGASIKSIIDGYLLMSFPLERTGVNGGSIRMATFGDGSTCFGSDGELGDTFIVNGVSGGEREVTLGGELEAVYAHYKDPGYAWLLSLNPNRNARTVYGRTPWSYIALTHGSVLPEKPTPPPAPCGIYPSQGFAVLRADESPAYWTSGSLAAVMRLGAAVGHGHEDYYSLVFHGKGRLLYPDINVIQYEPTYLGWTHDGIGHNTVLVDSQSPRPGEFSTRNEFAPECKFFAAAGSAYPGTKQIRALLLTKEYMADVFRVADEQKRVRTFDYVLHGLGRLYEGRPAEFRPSSTLIPNYWWIDNERSRTVASTWQADFVQHTAAATPGAQLLGKEWFEQTAGVRMTMLPGVTEVFCGDGPIVDGPPHARIDGNPEGSSPILVARRKATSAIFAAIHEPYDQRPPVLSVREINVHDRAAGIAINGPEFSDRVLVALENAADPVRLMGPNLEEFGFSDYAYIRIAGSKIIARGKLIAFKLRAPRAGDFTATLNGKDVPVKRDGDFLRFGTMPAVMSIADERIAEDPRELRAYLHGYVMPEEIHLAAGKEKPAELHLRCVGKGEAAPDFRFTAPPGITVAVAKADHGPLKEGEELTISFVVKAAPEMQSGLYAIRIEPAARAVAAPIEPGAVAAPIDLPVSVGVVMTEDKLRPRLAEYVVRAPGYTMRVDQFSGVSYYLLDADGHRRFGRLHNTNFVFGFPAISRDGKWCFCYRFPGGFIWPGQNGLTVGCVGTYNDHDVRLGYTFLEDRIVMKLIPPTRPDLDHTVWLGNFDRLGKASKTGTIQQPDGKALDWQFFPHPLFRQGVLLTVPSKVNIENHDSAVNMTLRAGQEVTLKFVAPDELPAQ